MQARDAVTSKRRRSDRPEPERAAVGRRAGAAATGQPRAIAEALVPVRQAAEVWQAATAEIERLELEYRTRVAELEGLQRQANGEVAHFNRLHTVDEAAERLRVSKRKVYTLVRRGALRSVRIDGSRRIPADEVSAYIARLLTAAPEVVPAFEERPT